MRFRGLLRANIVKAERQAKFICQGLPHPCRAYSVNGLCSSFVRRFSLTGAHHLFFKSIDLILVKQKNGFTFAPLKSKKCSVDSVAQQVEHIPFKDGVLGSSPSWITSAPSGITNFHQSADNQMIVGAYFLNQSHFLRRFQLIVYRCLSDIYYYGTFAKTRHNALIYRILTHIVCEEPRQGAKNTSL